MKSTFTKSTNSESNQKRGSNAIYHQSKSTNQSGNNLNINNYGNRGAFSPSNISKPTPTISKGVTNSETGKTTDYAKNGNKGISESNNIPKNKEKSNWQNNKLKAEPTYDNRHIGNTHSKVETVQDGDYILKITTTRKVIERGPDSGN